MSIVADASKLRYTPAIKFHLPTFGCQMNYNDADRLRTLLLAHGFVETDELLAADIVIPVTCSIRQHAEDRVWGLINQIDKHRRATGAQILIGLTGCMVRLTSTRVSDERDKLIKQSSDKIDFVFRIKEAGELPVLLRELNALPPEFVDADFAGYLQTMPTQLAKHTGFVPISTGCDHFCTYCIVPYSRGKEVCRPADEILAECRALIAAGAVELTLLGQNVNRYYFGKRSPNPQRSDFAELLSQVAQLDGLQWLRFTSPHPQHMGDDVLEVMASHDNICQQLHLPVQSGDDEILRRMARGYTVKQFRATLARARELMPAIALTTDIIVGFPSETDAQFSASLELCRAESFDQIFIGKYSARDNTPAAKWDNIPLDTKKARYHTLNDLLKTTAAANLAREVGQTCRVLVDSIETVDGTQLATGRTEQNRKISFPIGQRGKQFVGQFVEVLVVKTATFVMTGELV